MKRRATRQITVLGDVAYVPLTRGLVAVIDAADAEMVGRFVWAAVRERHNDYAVAHVPQAEGGSRRQNVRMHRLICGKPGWPVDHIDGDGLNNRRSNLRACDPSENNMNRGPQRNNKSGLKGVCFNKEMGKWRAQITARGKYQFLGYFADAASAHRAYADAAALLHGHFARAS